MTLCGLLCDRRRKKDTSGGAEHSHRRPARQGATLMLSKKPACAFCNNLLPRDKDKVHYLEYELTSEQLKSEAAGSCDFCSFIRAAADHVCSLSPQHQPSIIKVTGKRLQMAETIREYRERRNNQLGDSVDPSQIPLPNSDCSRRTSVESPYAQHTEQGLSDHNPWRNPSCLTITLSYEEQEAKAFYVYRKGPKDNFPWMLLETGPQLHLDFTGSTEAANFLQFVTSRCLQSHESCQPLSSHERWADETKIPKRILDISRHPKIRLIEKFPLDEEYACLSHCWGGQRALTTELSTLVDRKANIKWTDLPKTFQEAILFTKQLELQYIWIDSLCILQDDENDWLEESSKMASIYTNSYVTIAAMRAKDAHQGLFTLTDTTFHWQASDFVLHRSPQHLSVGKPEATLFPLLKRAWVFQEIMLSPRIIYFCDGEIVFECMEEWMCTCMCPEVAQIFHKLKYPIFNVRATQESHELTMEEQENGLIALLGLPREAVDGTLDFFLGKNRDKAPSEDPTPRHLGIWRDVVRYYSKLDLTFNKDRLPAISGLAHRLTERYGGAYAAGLWLEDLTRSLTWRSYVGFLGDTEPSPAMQCTGSTAPSWSWASIKGEVLFQGPIGNAAKEYYSLMSCDCEPVSHFDPFGRLRSARLTLRGRLFRFQMSDRRYMFEDKVVVSSAYWDPGQEYSESIPPFGIPISSTISSKNDPNPGVLQICHGLLLQQVADDTYQRVGVWENSHNFDETWGDPVWTIEKLDDKLSDLEMKPIILV